MTEFSESPLLAGPQHRIVYASEVDPDALASSVSEEIAGILEVAQRNNRELMVGGLLLYAGGYFCQVLEGPREAVYQLYEKIAADPRHTHCKVLLEEEIARRRYPGIPMALVGIDETPHPEIVGALTHDGDYDSNIPGQNLVALLEGRIDVEAVLQPLYQR